ncbi:MAG TPA: DUF5110 domain-containing protein, partial [Balneolaceae bacterium]|nr:DUF5110 domain-containing protein [Balneolaceae bacterium]
GPLENGTHEPRVSELNDSKIEPIAKKYDDLRYQLLPYNYTLAWQARSKGMPLMRALWLEYPNDKKAAETGDEYLWGKEMLIAPVYTKGAASRKVYLPKGQWYDWWTNRKISGGKTIKRKVNLSIMPIYVPAGSIIPMDPVRQYVHQKVKAPTTLRIYPGADGTFTLYDDDGKTLDYLHGQGEQVRFIWKNQAHKLIIEPTDDHLHGNFIKGRKFRIKVVSTPLEKTITYKGKRLVIKM